GWSPWIQAIVAATNASQLMRHDVWHLPGGCRLIAAAVSEGGDLAAALAEFDGARRPRCRQFARQAILIARFGFEPGPGWRQAARNTLLRVFPAAAAIRAGASVVRWSPPT